MCCWDNLPEEIRLYIISLLGQIYRDAATKIQIKWINYYINETGQHVFYLNEKPLGAINKEQLAFYKGK